ncbi:MAG: type II secretion system protein GspN [Desulfobacterales bacterium]|jgi:type II secretion system protein N|nr:type II secretion system protein GspN [Desulfobacterales bacterium]
MSVAARRIWVWAYLIGVLLACLAIGFPTDALRAHVAHRLSAGLPGVSVSIEGIRPALPPGAELQGVGVYRAGAPLLMLERLRVTPELLSLIGEATLYRFQGSVAGGEISGSAQGQAAKEQRGAVRMQAQWSGVLLQRLPALQGIHGSRVSGRMEGSLALSDQGSLTGKLRVVDSQVELARPLFDHKNFNFRSFDADLSLQNRTIVVRNGRLRGNEMDAELSGTVLLDPPAGSAALNISGRVTPHHAFMARLEGSLPAGLMRRRTAIPFKISGPLDSPALSFN